MIEPLDVEKQNLVKKLNIEVYGSHRIAKFELLEKKGVIHGFSWGEGNMAFSKVSDDVAKGEVKDRLKNFLSKAGMNDLESAVTMVGGNFCRVVDLSEARTRGEVTQDEMGARIDADTVFTIELGIPILLKPADCFGIIFSSDRGDNDQVSGITHAGRRQLGNKIVVESVQFLENHYGLSKDKIFAAVTAGLGQEHHIIKKDDIIRTLGSSIEYWRNYARIEEGGDWYIDLLSALKYQFKEAGILPENIQIDERDTYELNGKNELYSHRYFNDHRYELGIIDARYVVGIQNGIYGFV